MKKILLPFLLSLSIVLLNNCKKDEEDSDYVGKWVKNFSIDIDSVTTIDFKMIYTLGESSFTETYQFKYPDNKYYTEFEYKGSIKVENIEGQEEQKMIFNYTQYGLTDYDGLTGYPKGELTYYKKDAEDGVFDDEFSGRDNPEEIVFSIDTESNTMTQWFNWNGEYYEGYIEFNKTL